MFIPFRLFFFCREFVLLNSSDILIFRYRKIRFIIIIFKFRICSNSFILSTQYNRCFTFKLIIWIVWIISILSSCRFITRSLFKIIFQYLQFITFQCIFRLRVIIFFSFSFLTFSFLFLLWFFLFFIFFYISPLNKFMSWNYFI